MECCARCAAAHPSAKIVATAVTAPGPARESRPVAAADRLPSPVASGPQFSHSPAALAALPREVPAPRPGGARRRPACGKIAQRIVPHDLRPAVLRDELVELGDLFRAYQQRTEPDLAYLADLHARKAQAFTTWAEVTGDTRLMLDARRAEQAADAARIQHQQRTGQSAVGDGPVTDRLLTAPTLWEHARSVLAHLAEHTGSPSPEARLLMLMLTLRTALTGTGNLVGQDVASLPLREPEDLVAQLVDNGWLVLPGTISDLLASRPENPTQITVPSLVPDHSGHGPFAFGKKVRPKLSGWAQRVVSEKKLRKARTGADARLLAIALATRSDFAGRLGTSGEGIGVEDLASWCVVPLSELPALVERLSAVDWLTDAVVTDTHLTGRLSERVLPLSCPLA
ncbi:hypothetical protein [Streptomyces pratensis]|uniref:hypothetical protein n=1 Tax=Streptomyces pratensis TaxID=1169025 RepID=UPI0030159CCB